MRKIDLEAEREFENRKALGEDLRGKQKKFYWAIESALAQHNDAVLSEIKDKYVLEIGCASGYDAVNYSKFAKFYVGVDISDEAINVARMRTLPNSEFICVDGHKIPKGDQEFDCVIVNSLLHHLDLRVTFDEIYRILKEDGVLIFREPLGTNPLFNLYRAFTPGSRTVDERPFTFSDLRLMNSYFSFEHVQWFGFLNILSAFLKVRSVRDILSSIDRILSVTPVRYLFWQFSGVAKKKGVMMSEEI